MRTLRFFSTFLALSVLLSTASGPALAKRATWIEVSNDNFTVRSDADFDTVQTLIRDLERFRVVMAFLAGVELLEDPTPPLLIYLFTTVSEYQKEMQAGGTLGFYQNPLLGARMFLAAEDISRRGVDARAVLFHEYTHHLLHHFSNYRYPVWYDEGFAEYVSTIQFREKEGLVLLGDLPTRAAVVQGYPWIPCSEIVKSNGQYLAGSRMSISNTSMQYAQGWLMSHMFSSKPELGSKLNGFIAAVNKPGVDPMAAFEDAFGWSSIECNEQLKEYWNGGSLKYVQLTMPKVEVELTRRTLDPAEGAFQALEARFLAGRMKGSQPRYEKAFNKALKAGIREADMHRYLAGVALSRRSPERAMEYAEALVRLAPQAGSSYYTRASVRLGGPNGNGGEGIDAAQGQLVLKDYEKALELAPGDAAALTGYANAHLLPGVQVSDRALLAIDQARGLNADTQLIPLIKAKLLSKAGRDTEARVILEGLLNWARSKGQRKFFSKALDEVGTVEWAEPVAGGFDFW
ncbi:MAG: hypothetical protein AAGA68_06945 [Pseudomonadota bacterium]